MREPSMLGTGWKAKVLKDLRSEDSFGEEQLGLEIREERAFWEEMNTRQN